MRWTVAGTRKRGPAQSSRIGSGFKHTPVSLPLRCSAAKAAASASSLAFATSKSRLVLARRGSLKLPPVSGPESGVSEVGPALSSAGNEGDAVKCEGDDAAAADSPRTPSLIVGISSCPSADTTSVTPQPLAGDDSAAEGVGAGIIPTDKGMQAGVVCSELAVLSA